MEAMASSWHSYISPSVVLVYANHRLRKIMSGPNLVETKQFRISWPQFWFATFRKYSENPQNRIPIHVLKRIMSGLIINFKSIPMGILRVHVKLVYTHDVSTPGHFCDNGRIFSH